MVCYEYFRETVESITDDNWMATLYKHGNQGWELCSITTEQTYKMQTAGGTEVKDRKEDDQMQTIYVIIFKREL